MNFNHLDVDLLKISEEASLSKKEDPQVINATIGVFLNDYNNLYSFNSIEKAIKDANYDLLRRYFSVDGGKRYKENVVKYLFGNEIKNFKDHYINVFWTSGGSGAIYLGLKHFRGKSVYLPNLRWPEYDTTCLSLEKNIVEYNLIKDDKFDLSSINSLLKDEKGSVCIVINDPAHNPSGYTMSKSEYEELISLVNSYNNLNISILLDLAYVDYSTYNYQKEIIPLFKQFKKHVNLYIAFSGSKSFGVYGLRMGALIFVTKEKHLSDDFNKKTDLDSGAIYGAPNSLSVILLNDIINLKGIKAEQEKAKAILKERSELLIKELKENNLSYFPYDSGFFLTIKTNRPFEDANELKENKVYVVPTYKGLRIAISAIKDEEIKRLVKIIKENI